MSEGMYVSGWCGTNNHLKCTGQYAGSWCHCEVCHLPHKEAYVEETVAARWEQLKEAYPDADETELEERLEEINQKMIASTAELRKRLYTEMSTLNTPTGVGVLR